jgi:hypothetical protein
MPKLQGQVKRCGPADKSQHSCSHFVTTWLNSAAGALVMLSVR